MTVSTDLPDGTSAGLTIVHPTESELRQQWSRNGASWRGALSLPAYLRREEVLSDQDLTKNGGIHWWILVDSSHAPDNRPILAGCEVYKKNALISHNGKLEDKACYGVGSVFCLEEYRGKGYGARMMNELAQTFRNQRAKQDQDVEFSILFSDIGKKFYAKNGGWEPFSSSHVSVKLDASTPSFELPEVRPLHASDIPSLCADDTASMRKQLVKRTEGNNKYAIAQTPNIKTIQWHHAREDFVGQELHGHSPEIKGGMVGSEPGSRAWMYWTRMWYNTNPNESKENTMHILRLVVEDGLLNAGQTSTESNGNTSNGTNGHSAPVATDSPQVEVAIEALLRVAQREAQQWNMEEIQLWNPTEVTLEAARRVQSDAPLVDRETDSIACLMWLGDEPELKDGGPVAEKIDWLGNEKYGWC